MADDLTVQGVTSLDGIYYLTGHFRTGGNFRYRFVNVYVDGQDVRFLQERATPVGPTDTVIILPAMAGG